MAAGAIAGAAAAAAAAAARRQAILTANSVWEPYARSRGYSYSPGRIGWAHVQWPRVDGAIQGIAVAIDLLAGSGGFSTVSLAVPAAPLEGHVQVTREGLGAKICKLFGGQDIVLGDDAFDRAFVVKGTSETTVRAVLSANLRREMLELHALHLAYDDGSDHKHVPLALFEIGGVLAAPALLDRALAAVVEMARTRQQEAPYR